MSLYARELALAAALVARFALLAVSGAGCAATESGKRTMQVDLPRAPAKDEALALEVQVGSLPRGARLVVRTDKGEIVGAISPFGAQAAQKGGRYTLSVPAGATTERKLMLRLDVEEKGTNVSRAPKDNEIESIRAVLVPVTPRADAP